MANVYKLRMRTAPNAPKDGSGQIKTSVLAIRSRNDGETWEAVEGWTKDFYMPWAEVKVAMDLPHSNSAERQAKIAATKDVMEANVATTPQPITREWKGAVMEAFTVANDAALVEAARFTSFLVDTLNQSFATGVDFVLSL